eukprot:1101345-Amphidinium_carterae.3
MKFTGYEPKSGDQQEHPEEEDVFADPGPEAAEKYALREVASSSTGPRGHSATVPEFDISGGDQDELDDQLLVAGIARSIEDAPGGVLAVAATTPTAVAVGAHAQHQTPRTPRIHEGLRNELETQLIQMRAAGQHAHEELTELRQEINMTQHNLQQNIVVVTDQTAVEMLQGELIEARSEGQCLQQQCAIFQRQAQERGMLFEANFELRGAMLEQAQQSLSRLPSTRSMLSNRFEDPGKKLTRSEELWPWNSKDENKKE